MVLLPQSQDASRFAFDSSTGIPKIIQPLTKLVWKDPCITPLQNRLLNLLPEFQPSSKTTPAGASPESVVLTSSPLLFAMTSTSFPQAKNPSCGVRWQTF